MQSFDIFDTILVRTWAKPTDLFWELGVQLQQTQLITVSPATWQKIRVEAESVARQKILTGEVTLNQIYEELKTILNWSIQEVEEALKLELKLEKLSLRPIPEIQRKIQDLHQLQQPIAYLSDMYLPTETIKDFLKEYQIWANGDQLYVSAEAGVGKGSGELFQYFMLQNNLKVSELHHTGDNLHSDFKVPQKLGIKVTPFRRSHLNRYERLIADDPKLSVRFRSFVAGSSRLCRLHCPETDFRRQTIWDTAANVIAPLVFGFVHWVLQQAKQQGIQRLYFMARDGQILLKVAQIICHQWGYDLDCRYLYGSRQAFHFPALQTLGEHEFNWILDNPAFLSVRIVCQRVNLEPEKIADTLIHHGFLRESWDRNLAHHEVLALKAVLQEPSVSKMILTLAKTYREKAVGYFKQEGMADGIPFATVDIGWSGKSQRSLSQILAAAQIYPATGLQGFFFGLLSKTQAFSTDCLMSYFLESDQVSERRFLCDSQILELFLAADHGSTVRYEQQDDRYHPILRSQKNESGIAWGVLVQQEAIVEFTKYLTENLQPDECKVEYFQQVTEELLHIFINSPNRAESEAFGTQSFSQHQSESRFYDLAPAYNWIDGIKMLFDWQYVHSFAWLPASIHRSHPLTRLPLRFIKRLRSSLTYAYFAWQEFEKENEQQARNLGFKALQANPIILLSKRFSRMGLFLTAKAILRLKNDYQILIRKTLW
ncbi:hypothetical protein [Chroococcus sp. FPU101]|uniref:HAD family hydrolase n=1 Tax=Chroococcus sp. FPU101 TaxID=1974212 RepID=UPI001A9024AD|nr:hypothetical protein [Chroococcus sp. FPU101]GFE68206.1 hypothetical protein CFPU101_08160 [Chroococcus sp. FPU101]